MLEAPPEILYPVVVHVIERIGKSDLARKGEFGAMASPGEISLEDSNTHIFSPIGGVLLTRLEDHRVGIRPGSLFAITEIDQPQPIFRLLRGGGYKADKNILVKDVQVIIWNKE